MPLEKHELKEDEDDRNEYAVFANRENSSYKWQRARNVVGALEVVSEPVLRPSAMEPRYYKGREVLFKEAMKVWEDENLQKEFVSAFDSLPVETCCCGFMRDQDGSKKEFVRLLNDKWARRANRKLSNKGYVVSWQQHGW